MGLHHGILNDPVSALELRKVIVVAPDTTVRDAVNRMQQSGLGCVVVVDQNTQVVGKFTERRLLKLLLDSTCLDEPVERHLTRDKGLVKLSDPIAKVIDCMEAEKLRFVIVLDDAGRPVGLTGQKGVAEYIADHFPRQVKVQETGAKLHMDQREGA